MLVIFFGLLVAQAYVAYLLLRLAIAIIVAIWRMGQR